MSVHASVARAGLEPRLEVFQTYEHAVTYHQLFSVTIPVTDKQSSRIIGDTGEIHIDDIKNVMRFIQKNRMLLLGHWKEDEDCCDCCLLDSVKRI